MLKIAYFEGAQEAFHNLGLSKKREKPLWRSALPAAAGVAGAAALYPLLRRVNLSKIPALRQLQQASKGHLTHVTSDAPQALTKHWLGKFLGPERITRWLRGADQVVMPGSKNVPRRAPGAIFSTVPEASAEPAMKGTVDLGMRASRKMPGEWEDKLYEAEQLHKLMPGVAGRAEHIPYLEAEGRRGQLQELQKYMREKKLVLKPRYGSASGDVILPTDDLIKMYLKGGKRKDWLRGALDESNAYLLQEQIPIQMERRLPGSMFGTSHPGRAQVPREFRVHVINGVVVPEAITQRTPGISNLNPFRQRRIRREIVEQLQPHINKLPKELRHNQILPLDVVQTPAGGYRIIETNAGGGFSGFMAPEEALLGERGAAITRVPHGVYRAITGRHSAPAALTKALAGGGALASAAGIGNAAID